jgi:hypothetical protein
MVSTIATGLVLGVGALTACTLLLALLLPLSFLLELKSRRPLAH